MAKTVKKDHRYKVVKIMLDRDEIGTFKEIFKYIPKSTVAKDLRINNNRMTRLIEEPGGFTFKEVQKMATLIGVDFMTLAGMIAKVKD